MRAYADNLWPSQAYGIAVNAGLEDAYKDLVPESRVALQDYALPASTFTGKGVSSIPVRTIGDATRTLWLAPSIQQPDNNGASQRWTLVAGGNGYYKIKNVRDGAGERGPAPSLAAVPRFCVWKKPSFFAE
ncbi:hypothetical protein ACFPH6_01065 [Streptomyces xiangluensis]|uniref:Ricin B lectin domain-containing protein n=1 Tax=Streptomyces xiangluensis TaxID=2665720 RepID=A0ABV8YGC7_9ACTN